MQREDAEEVADVFRNLLQRYFAIAEIQKLGDAQERERNGIHAALVHQHEQQERHGEQQKDGKSDPGVAAVAQLADPEQIGHLQKDHERDHGPDSRVGVKRKPVEQRREHQEFRALDTLRKKVQAKEHECGGKIRFEPPARQHDVPGGYGEHEQHGKRLAGSPVHLHQLIKGDQREDAGQQHRQANNPHLEAENRDEGDHQVGLERVHAGTPGGEVHGHAEPEGIPRRGHERVGVVARKGLVLVDVGGDAREHEAAGKNTHGKENPEKTNLYRSFSNKAHDSGNKRFHGQALLFQLDDRRQPVRMVIGIGAMGVRLEPENLDAGKRHRGKRGLLRAALYRGALPKDPLVAIDAENDLAIFVDLVVDTGGNIKRIGVVRQDVDDARRSMGAYPIPVLPSANLEGRIFHGLVHHGHLVVLPEAIELDAAQDKLALDLLDLDRGKRIDVISSVHQQADAKETVRHKTRNLEQADQRNSLRKNLRQEEVEHAPRHGQHGKGRKPCPGIAPMETVTEDTHVARRDGSQQHHPHEGLAPVQHEPDDSNGDGVQNVALVHARQQHEERSGVPRSQFEHATQRLAADRGDKRKDGEQDEQRLAHIRGAEPEERATLGQAEERVRVGRDVAHREHPEVRRVVGGKRVLRRGVDIGAAQHSPEVIAQEERQEDEDAGDNRKREALPGTAPVLDEKAAEHRQEEDHLELREQRQNVQRSRKHGRAAEIDAVQRRKRKRDRDEVHLAPHRAAEQDGGVQRDNGDQEVLLPAREIVAVDNAAGEIHKEQVREIYRPQAKELEEECLCDNNSENGVDLRDHPEPENIKRRIVPAEVAEAAVNQRLDPPHPKTLVTIVRSRKRTEQIRNNTNHSP